MTQLLSLWNEVFAKQSKTANLEQFINSYKPASEHDVEEALQRRAQKRVCSC